MLLLEVPARLPTFPVSPKLIFQMGHILLKGHLGRVWSCPWHILQLGAYCRVSSVSWFILYFAGKVFLQLVLKATLAVKTKSALTVGKTSISALSPQIFLRMLVISASVARGVVHLMVLGAVATIWIWIWSGVLIYL